MNEVGSCVESQSEDAEERNLLGRRARVVRTVDIESRLSGKTDGEQGDGWSCSVNSECWRAFQRDEWGGRRELRKVDQGWGQEQRESREEERMMANGGMRKMKEGEKRRKMLQKSKWSVLVKED